MGDRPGKLAQHRNTGQMRNLLALCCSFRFSSFLLGDINKNPSQSMWNVMPFGVSTNTDTALFAVRRHYTNVVNGRPLRTWSFSKRRDSDLTILRMNSREEVVAREWNIARQTEH